MNELSFLSGGNAAFIAELYARYTRDNGSVDPGWASFFSSLSDDEQSVFGEIRGASWQPRMPSIIGIPEPEVKPAPPPMSDNDRKADTSTLSPEQVRSAILDSVRALMLIRAYRVRGHLEANIDPLGLLKRPPHPELDYRNHGFTDADLDRQIFIDHVLGLETATLRQIISILKETYCGSIGVEFTHIQDPEQKSWIQRRIESIHNQTDFTERGKHAILERLTEAEEFERFLQTKYIGTKRFGLEGGETLIPVLEQIIKRGSQMGLEEAALGMAHRGRLNVLVNFLNKPYQAVFYEFQGSSINPLDFQGSGDVKYHLGTSANREFDGIPVHLSLTANPSHLEVVDAVVLGKVRAKQNQRGDQDRQRVLSILIHGDAAFAGQGVVAECLAMSQITGYTTGGTVHIIVNNQIGFTTSPKYSRSGPYCSDVAKYIQAPIFHVNADDPEAAVHVARIASEFRQTFKADAVIDMVCYRRHGHNESDEPAFTQPVMYRTIAQHPTTRQIYAEKLIREGVITPEEPDTLIANFREKLESEFQAAKDYKVEESLWFGGKWAGLAQLNEDEEFREERTDVDIEQLKKIGAALTRTPENFNAHSKIIRQLEAKRAMIETAEKIDWSTAEALAFGSLLSEGIPVRLSGQDCGRGTFSQRHSILVDQENENNYIPLNHIDENQAQFEVLDSLLSEEGVLGFEYGYSLSEPNALTLWEAQFGDFANGAQAIIDQFISSAESKWMRLSGLVLLLPHGYEGQGPEHSSARWERYLQLCAEDNWQVCNFTTPANYFHGLRRQICRNFRKPLVVMTPKSLLRHKLCVSNLLDFASGSRFYRVIPETQSLRPDSEIKRVILCSGKVYYDLFEERIRRELDDVAIIRIEQLYPWPKDTIRRQLERYPNADVIWCQEEPGNMGPWFFVDRRIQFILEELKHKAQFPAYAGRKLAASPATGLYKTHIAEQALLLDQAFAWPVNDLTRPGQRTTALAKITPNEGRK